MSGSAASTLDAPPRLVDLASGLTALTTLFSELRPIAEAPQGAGILYVHMASSELIEERFGWEALEAYNALVSSHLQRVCRGLVDEREHCVLVRAFADDYVILAIRREDDEALPELLADGLRRHLQAVDEEIAAVHEVYVGRASTSPFARVHPERRLYRGIQQAQQEATDIGRQQLAAQARRLDACIKTRMFRLVYQPIVDVHDFQVYAYEALVRCDEEQLSNPHILLNIAEQSGRIEALSRLLRNMALEAVPHMPDERLMFINVHPLAFEDPELSAEFPLIAAHANRVVFEITERAAIADYVQFRSRVERLREGGAHIAVDDLGAGYTALSSVAEVNPDFIKFDMTLIRGIDESPVRQNLLRNMVAFAVEANVKVIAEGVETEEELATVIELGCNYVQGFLLARPAANFIETIERPSRD